MRPALVFSLVAALGIHAVILLVPRAALVEEPKVLPSVVIDLSEASTIMATSPRASPAPLPPPPAPRPAPLPSSLPIVQPAPREPVPSAVPEPEPRADTASVEPTASAQEAAAADASPPTPPAATESSGTGRGGQDLQAGPPVRLASVAAGPAGDPAVPSAERELVPPQPRVPIQPAYPRGARQSGAQGLVKVSVMVDERGVVTGAEVLLSSGSGPLDRAALDAVRRTVFTPARRGGISIACRVVVPIRFQLSAAR